MWTCHQSHPIHSNSKARRASSDADFQGSWFPRTQEISSLGSLIPGFRMVYIEKMTLVLALPGSPSKDWYKPGSATTWTRPRRTARLLVTELRSAAQLDLQLPGFKLFSWDPVPKEPALATVQLSKTNWPWKPRHTSSLPLAQQRFAKAYVLQKYQLALVTLFVPSLHSQSSQKRL